jgi:hypothetical protein
MNNSIVITKVQKEPTSHVSHRQIPKFQTLHLKPLTKMCVKIKPINPTNWQFPNCTAATLASTSKSSTLRILVQF